MFQLENVMWWGIVNSVASSLHIVKHGICYNSALKRASTTGITNNFAKSKPKLPFSKSTLKPLQASLRFIRQTKVPT